MRGWQSSGLVGGDREGNAAQDFEYYQKSNQARSAVQISALWAATVLMQAHKTRTNALQKQGRAGKQRVFDLFGGARLIKKTARLFKMFLIIATHGERRLALL